MKRLFALLLILGFGIPLELPAQLAHDVLANDTLANDGEGAAKKFVAQLSQKHFDEAAKAFDAAMTKAMPVARLEQTWASLTASAGEFQSVRATRKQVKGRYKIELVDCKFARANWTIKVVLDRNDRITGLFFLPSKVQEHSIADYVDATTFTDEEVSFGTDPWIIPGTLSIPKANSNRASPVVILVLGSGPNDRDESVGACKPFKDLAGGLASRGIAVLRYEKRSRAHQTKLADLESLTVHEETVEDVIAAFNFVQSHPAINKQRIFVIGHSLGGYLVPRIDQAREDRPIAGYVSLNGNARSVETLILAQTRYLAQLDGSVTPKETNRLKLLEGQIDELKTLTVTSPALLGAPAAYWLDLRDYRANDEIKRVTCPILFLQGERDYQVTMIDFGLWKESLRDRTDVHFKSYPSLNHLLIEGSGRSTPEEYDVAGNVAFQVIEDISVWIQNR